MIKIYDTKKIGLFRVPHPENTYTLGEGWKQIIEKYTIIGEDETSFIYSIHKSTWGEWIDDKVIQQTHVIPLGIHKSRLVQWTGGQLTLF